MSHFLMNTIWLSDGLCFIRLTGDLCLAASSPWLLFTIHRHGVAGISVETQLLRLIVFSARYLDLFSARTVSTYNTYCKIIILATTLHAVVSLIFSHKAYKLADLKNGIYRLCLPLLFAMLMAPIFTYRYTFVEISWCFSQFLGIFSDIPQMMLVVNPKNRTRGVVTYMALAAGYRAFYIPHWILLYFRSNILDSIAVLSGVITTLSYLVTSLIVIWGQYRLNRSRSQSLEEGERKILDSSISPLIPGSHLIVFPEEKS